MNKYETIRLETDRLILDQGNSEDSKFIYQYDYIKCTGIDNQNEIKKLEEPIDFIGDNKKEYYNSCKKEKMYDWYVYLKDKNIPVANIVIDRENEKESSIEASYNTHPEYWGKGYVPEALDKIMSYLKRLGYKKVYIHLYHGNDKSKRVCEKLGFKYVSKKEEFYAPTNKMIMNYEYMKELD